MPPFKDDALEHVLKRWMRPDACNFVRPDWRRFTKPGSEAAVMFGIYEQKYRPDQLRDKAGRWVDEGGGAGSNSGPRGGRIPYQVAGACEEMHRRDLFICKAFQSPACYTQAYLRYTNCQLGKSIPPLNF